MNIEQLIIEDKKIRTVGLIILVGLTIGLLTFVVLSIITEYSERDNYFCDYDSCSQEVSNWRNKYNISTCFERDNPLCEDFLILWDSCKKYQERLGVC